jgi:hypothetical protein
MARQQDRRPPAQRPPTSPPGDEHDEHDEHDDEHQDHEEGNGAEGEEGGAPPGVVTREQLKRPAPPPGDRPTITLRSPQGTKVTVDAERGDKLRRRGYR